MTEVVSNSTKTFADMIDEAKFFIADGEIVFPLAHVEKAINMGLSMVHNSMHREPIDAYFVTAPGVRSYSVPDTRYDGGFASIESIWSGDNLLDSVDYDIVKTTDAQGEPTSFSTLGNRIHLTPVPDGAYTIHVLFLREFVPLVNQSDTADMSDVEIHAGIMYACFLMKMKDEEFQSANAFLGAYNEALSTASRFPSGLYSGEDGRMK